MISTLITGKGKRPKVVIHNSKNIVNHNQTRTLDSVTPVEEPVDFLSSEANDGLSIDLNALDSIVDIKPVTTFTIKNLHNSKIQKKPLMVLIDTGKRYQGIAFSPWHSQNWTYHEIPYTEWHLFK